MHDGNAQHMAFSLLGRLLQQSDLDVCSRALGCTNSAASEDRPGSAALEYLTTFGNNTLEHGRQDWTCTVVIIMQRLSNIERWRKEVLEYITTSIDKLREDITSGSILSLLVSAGFPNLVSTGVEVCLSSSYINL